MALELRQQLRLTQQLIMTPQLQQAIKLLQLSRLELLDAINEELQENPVLDEVQEESPSEIQPLKKDDRSDRADESQLLKPVTIEEKTREDFDWTNYVDEYNTPGPSYFAEGEEQDGPKYENVLSRPESLDRHLEWQLLLSNFTPDEEDVGSLIIGNLNPDGYLQASVDEMAEMAKTSSDFVERVLRKMQTFDPVGVCARGLKECLLIQAKYLGITDPVFFAIIENHLKNLENKNYKAIAKDLSIDLDDVIACVDIITGLEPKPGRQFSEEESQYISPDIFVYKMGDDFVIVLNDDGMPKLRISAFYKNTISKSNKDVSDNTREYIRNKLKSAVWLIRSIHQRQRTIYKVVESIVGQQREFLEKGINYLKPMVLRDVAEDIGMHESTISRVTTNKYVHTPQGIFELKFFFSSSINRVYGEAIASASVKEKIRQIIQSEDTTKPYSDRKMVAILAKANIHIARRTVAKYRESLGVLPSSKRKRFKAK
ncbi:MAG: RNA polymerase factor sigma-54 [Deltaproteobacteria bacterium]|nr:RNA polymerase factor sigma-54 [Deltaproteobacteria bacterium]